MKKPIRKILLIVFVVVAFVPLRKDPDTPPIISKAQYVEFVRPHLLRNVKPPFTFMYLPKEDRIPLKVRTGFDYGGRSLLGIMINFTSFQGHGVGSVPKELVKDFAHVDGCAWVSKKELHLLNELFSSKSVSEASVH